MTNRLVIRESITMSQMSNINLTLVAGPEDFQIIEIFIGGNGIADPSDLALVRLPADIDWRKGIILDGRAPIWLYTYLTHLCHPTAWLAVGDPRYGAIVIAGHVPISPAVGSVIPIEKLQQYRRKPEAVSQSSERTRDAARRIIAFVGPPNSGKSVLLRALYDALRITIPVEEFQRDVFLFRACPDGEGNWFGEIPPEFAATLRYKHQWDDSFVTRIGSHLDGIATSKRLVLVDLGGRIDRRNQQILNRCTHAVIVSNNPQAVSEWSGALKASDVEVIARIDSVRTETSDVLGLSPLHLRFGALDRDRRDIRLPAEFINIFK